MVVSRDRRLLIALGQQLGFLKSGEHAIAAAFLRQDGEQLGRVGIPARADERQRARIARRLGPAFGCLVIAPPDDRAGNDDRHHRDRNHVAAITRP